MLLQAKLLEKSKKLLIATLNNDKSNPNRKTKQACPHSGTGTMERMLAQSRIRSSVAIATLSQE